MIDKTLVSNHASVLLHHGVCPYHNFLFLDIDSLAVNDSRVRAQLPLWWLIGWVIGSRCSPKCPRMLSVEVPIFQLRKCRQFSNAHRIPASAATLSSLMEMMMMMVRFDAGRRECGCRGESGLAA